MKRFSVAGEAPSTRDWRHIIWFIVKWAIICTIGAALIFVIAIWSYLKACANPRHHAIMGMFGDLSMAARLVYRMPIIGFKRRT